MTGIYLRCDLCGDVLDKTNNTPTGTYHWSQQSQLQQEARERGWSGSLSRSSDSDLCPPCTEFARSHKLTLIPQPIADQWMAECSCGKFRSAASFYDFNTKDDLLDELKRRYVEHCRDEKARLVS